MCEMLVKDRRREMPLTSGPEIYIFPPRNTAAGQSAKNDPSSLRPLSVDLIKEQEDP